MSMAPSRFTVRPGRGLSGRFRPPGDKSITHRAYLLGALAEGETVVENPNPGADCAATLACVAALGAGVACAEGLVRIAGRAMALSEPDRVLDCGNSGTTLRLLAGVLATQRFLAVLAGDASLHRRPVDRVIEPLSRMGATLIARDGNRLPPLVVRGAALRGIHYRLPVSSAQVASCVLLAGLAAEGSTTVELGPARDHTENMLPAFGVPLEVGPAGTDGRHARTLTGPRCPRGIRLEVPGDFSAAAFFLAAAAAVPGASVTATGVNLNPTRTGLLEVLESMGAGVERHSVHSEGGEPVGDVTVIGPERLEACDIPAALVPRMIDEIPAWTIAATAASGTSRVSGAGELRIKESDRLAALAAQLSRLGIRVEERPDGLAIRGGPLAGGDVDAAGDHRIAMTLALLGTRAAGAVTVRGAGEIATSFPGFAATLAALGGEIADAGPEASRT
jgi:3-phosphoshikimate 1-carboxyvinyltransferase